MSEHPILFQPWKVRQIREWDFAANGDMQTRRVVQPQPTGRVVSFDATDGLWYSRGNGRDIDWLHHCPYGQPGDLLVPLTTWAVHRRHDHLKPLELPRKPVLWSYWESDWKPARFGRLRPGRFLPKRLRHLLPRLENTGVSVERLQDISDAEVVAEGVGQQHIDKNRKFFHKDDVHGLAFAEVWNSINARPKPSMHNPYTDAREKCQVAYPWDDVTEATTINRKASSWDGCKVYVVGNPSVWVVRFKRVEG